MELSHEHIVSSLQISIPPSIHIEKAVLIPSNKSKKDRARLYYRVSEGSVKQKEKNITGIVDELSFLEAVSEALISIGSCRDTMETTEALSCCKLKRSVEGQLAQNFWTQGNPAIKRWKEGSWGI